MKLPITKPYITGREKELVVKPLETGWLVQGPFVNQLEEMMAAYTGAKHAIATTSCTTAQFIASRCIDIDKGDEVIVPAFTWISTANAAEVYGAKPVFVDIDLDTFSIDLNEVIKKITPKTKAIYTVNLFGLPCNMQEIMDIANKYKLRVIEDCACSLGGFIEGKHTGVFGDCGCFSFHPRKSITTGEGGMLITNDDNIAKIARSLRDHGAMKTDYERHHGEKAFLLTEYELLGYNYRMTDIQGAIGVAQFEKVPEIMEKKQSLAKIFNTKLEKLNFLQAPIVPENYTHGYQAYVTIFEPIETLQAIKDNNIDKIHELNKKRNLFMYNLEKIGISTRQGTHAVHIQKYYAQKYNLKPADYINAFAADKLSLALPFYPTMTNDEVEYLFDTLSVEYKKIKE